LATDVVLVVAMLHVHQLLVICTYQLVYLLVLLVLTISLEMPVPSEGHYGFQFSGCWLICLFI
jgi:hypothetical protein